MPVSLQQHIEILSKGVTEIIQPDELESKLKKKKSLVVHLI